MGEQTPWTETFPLAPGLPYASTFLHASACIHTPKVAEETIRSVVGSVINPASSGSDAQTRGYFSEEEERIIDNMVFGMPSAAAGGGETTGAVDGGGGGGGHVSGGSNMGYSEGDLATHFGRDARRGHHHHHHDSGRPYGHQQHQWQQGLLTSGPGSLRHRQPRLLALAARARYAIRLSIMRTSKAVPTMRFPQMVACGMVFACRAVTKNPWCGAASFVGARCERGVLEWIGRLLCLLSAGV